MYSPETHVLIHQEQYQDRLREIERQRLVRLVAQQNSDATLARRTARWLGAQMVTWGSKLQRYAVVKPYTPAIQ